MTSCKRFSRLSVALLVLVLAGCGGQPQISKANVRLIEKLHTALAAKNTQWLEAAAKQIKQHQESGKLSAEEFEALEPIIAQARQSHWDEANALLGQLISGQRRG